MRLQSEARGVQPLSGHDASVEAIQAQLVRGGHPRAAAHLGSYQRLSMCWEPAGLHELAGWLAHIMQDPAEKTGWCPVNFHPACDPFFMMHNVQIECITL